MCGVIGIYLKDANKSAFPQILNALTVLQHRGTDAAGIYTSDGIATYKHKGVKKVERVFDEPSLLVGNMGIGHVRYSTIGNLTIESAQPLNFQNISLVHNGNLTNTEDLQLLLGIRDSKSDSNIMLRLFVQSYVLTQNVFAAVKTVMDLCKGSFSTIIMIPSVGLIAFRDPRGIRPLCFGKTADDYAFASESVALGIELERDVGAGECIVVSDKGIECRILSTNIIHTPCLFEYIYFARPESIIDGILVYQARKNMGETLALRIIRDYPDVLNQIDVVMPVPDSARISALRASYVLQKPYCEGLIKNNYIGRTFIMPSQMERKKSLKMKLNTIEQEFREKTVLIIDDSIVRGNTSIQIVELIRKAGAKRIIFASIAPPVINRNVYGIAIPSEDELIAAGNEKYSGCFAGGIRSNSGELCSQEFEKYSGCKAGTNSGELCSQEFRTDAEIAGLIGADIVIYNLLDDVVDACRRIRPMGVEKYSGCKVGGILCSREFETSCFRK